MLLLLFKMHLLMFTGLCAADIGRHMSSVSKSYTVYQHSGTRWKGSKTGVMHFLLCAGSNLSFARLDIETIQL